MKTDKDGADVPKPAQKETNDGGRKEGKRVEGFIYIYIYLYYIYIYLFKFIYFYIYIFIYSL